MILARIKASKFKWKMIDQIDLFRDAYNNRRLVEEVVVSGGGIGCSCNYDCRLMLCYSWSDVLLILIHLHILNDL